MLGPTLEYACQVWHSSITNQQASAIENIQKRAVRIILGVQYESYTSALHKLGILSLKSRRDDLLLKFGKSLLNSRRFRDMLPPYKDSVSSRELRSSTLTDLVMPKCRTVRFKNSTIPSVVRILS